ncbi:LOW QUALITY PROTEIN: nestin [Cygnus olor]|uniref:LOW QUALITY PROTEIN: nestin n=1 Tax=Cygnus olor TaxID=8869 RepID=UPI001ADE5B9F|nr:LOW QUALITY PROTEIN: nestin [Cygnus olor]
MLSMEGLVGARLLGEESLQMWDLNKRLEAYLARVKFLEEENEGLRAEIRGAKSGPAAEPWRAKYEEELRALRAALERAFREKCSAELARDNLYEEVQHVKSRCQKEQAAREEAKRQLAAGKKELEEERRAQIWLKERAVQLEKEVGALLEVHEEEKAGLDRELASFSLSLESLRCVPAAFQPLEVEDYSRRLAEIWRGAVETYKAEVAQLEGSLGQAKESLWKAAEDNQQSQLQLQHLDKELAALRARKELLEDNLARQWQEQRGEAEKFQLAIEALEQEKQSLRAQIAQVLEDRQQLMHLKMSLSLEVATYRTLLEAESTRLQMAPGEFKLANGLRDVKLEASSSKHRAGPAAFPWPEGTAQPPRAPGDALKAPTPKTKSPGAREFQKISSVLQAPKAREPAAPTHAAPLLSPGSPGAEGPARPGGDAGERSPEEPPEGPEEPPGTPPAQGQLYPEQLVSHVLQDALKEMQDDAQPKEEPALSAACAPRDARSPGPSPPVEAREAEEAGDEGGEPALSVGVPEMEEEEAGGGVPEGLGGESSAQQDGTGPRGAAPASPSDTESQEETGPWEEEEEEEEGSKEEEIPSPPSPEQSGGLRGAPREGDVSGPIQAGTGEEEPEPGEDDVEATSTEALHLSEDEEPRGAWSPSREDEELPEQERERREEECPQGEIEAACALPVGSRPVLPSESSLEEEDLVGGEQEEFGHQEMPPGGAAAAAGGEREQETCPELEPPSSREAGPAEEDSLGAEGGETADGAGDGEEEEGGEGEEAMGGEHPRAGEAWGDEELRQESGGLEEPEELQEDGLEQDTELQPGEDAWGTGDEDNGREHRAEDWEGAAGDAEGTGGDANVTPQEPARADDNPPSTGAPESQEGAGGTSPAEVKEAQEEDEEAAGSEVLSQQQAPTQGEEEQEAEPAPGLEEAEQGGTTEAPGDAQDPSEALEEVWEAQGAAGELGSEPAELESGSTDPAEPQQDPGSGVGSAEPTEEDAQRSGTGRIELEDTLPDSTPLSAYQGEMLAAASPNPVASEEATETAPGAETELEDDEQLGGSHEAAAASVPDSHKEESETELAPATECAEEEEGYFMVSAPSQEASSWEEAEISEDFEEIKVEAAEAGQEDLKAPGDASPEPEAEEHLEAFGGEDEDVKMPPEEQEMPKDEDEDDAGGFAAELEEGSAVPAAQPSSPVAEGLSVGHADEAPQGDEGRGHSEGSAAEPEEELDGTGEQEHGASGEDVAVPGCDALGPQGPAETPPGQEDERIPPAELQPPAAPVSPPPEKAEQAPAKQLPLEEDAQDGDSPPDKGPSDAEPPSPGSPLEQGGFAEAEDSPEAPALPAQLPADVLQDSDILEIVEQALELNQELVLGARLAAGGQGAGGSAEPPQEDEGGSSSSEEQPTVQEAPAEPCRAEGGELNGLHRQASLEDLAEFAEEGLNGIAGEAPAAKPADAPQSLPLPGKHGGADAVPALSPTGTRSRAWSQSPGPRGTSEGGRAPPPPTPAAPLPLDNRTPPVAPTRVARPFPCGF